MPLDFNVKDNMIPVFYKTDWHLVDYSGKAFRGDSIASYFGEYHDHPRAFYLSPIHCGRKFLGIAALSFGKKLLGYDETYMHFIRNIEAALDRLLSESFYRHKLKKSYYTIGSSVLNMNGLFDWLQVQENNKKFVFVCCEILDIKLLYGRYGGKKVAIMIKDSLKRFTDFLEEDECCGVLTDSKVFFVLHSPERAERVFMEMKRASIYNGEAYSFSFGEMLFSPGSIEDITDIYELMGEASNNTKHTYKQNNNRNHQLYEKLFNLRKKLENTPENQWNIDTICRELHVSRSTLQKNYKEIFGKSIIEELIGKKASSGNCPFYI